MEGILLSQVGGEYKLVDNLKKPKPGKGQVLVKSLATAINPVYFPFPLLLLILLPFKPLPFNQANENLANREGIMQSSGILITSFPIVLGCDASGIVVEIGEGVGKFKVGDKVFGCTRLGCPGYSTFQEFVSLLPLIYREK